MLQLEQLVDILATLLMTCLGLLGWTHLYEEQSFQTETVLAVEMKSPNIVEEGLCSNDHHQIDFQNANIKVMHNSNEIYL